HGAGGDHVHHRDPLSARDIRHRRTARRLAHLEAGMLRGYAILLYLFLYGPIALIVVFSFNSGLSAADFQGFSLKWYAKVATNELMLSALRTSAIVAFSSAALATIMGTMAALAL